jgi:2-amino-4-hydroxy-6-hydroxymethyldihydropteridine diphosphokinase
MVHAACDDTGKPAAGVQLGNLAGELAGQFGRRSSALNDFVAELVYLSLGSNMGDRPANLRRALDRLAEAGPVQAVSAVYETEPVDVRDQPWFLNCVVAVESVMPPRELLGLALAIERAMGRNRTREKGPRTIDIDILLCGNSLVAQPGLHIPHPAMHQRRFVLEPLAEIAPEAFHPVLRRTARELLAELPAGQTVRRLPGPIPESPITAG